MKLELFQHSNKKNWHPVLQLETDSEQSLALAFSTPAFDKETNAFTELHKTFSKYKSTDYSTAGKFLPYFDKQVCWLHNQTIITKKI